MSVEWTRFSATGSASVHPVGGTESVLIRFDSPFWGGATFFMPKDKAEDFARELLAAAEKVAA